MNTSFDAVILLLLLVLIIIYVIFDRMFVVRNIVKIIVTITILIVVSFIFFHTLEIQSFAPAYRLLPAIAASLVFANVSRYNREGCGFITGAATILFFIFLIGMSMEYLLIIGNKSKYTDSLGDSAAYYSKTQAEKLSSAKMFLSMIMDQEEKNIGKRYYKAGKVADMEIMNSTYTRSMRDMLEIKKPIAKRFWHTWLTGIYGVEYYPLWYPGGVLNDNYNKIYYKIN